MKKSNVNMLSGSIVKGLLALSIPIMIMNVMQVVFNAIDLAALRYLTNDNYSVGAVGAGSSLTGITINFLVGISTGANVVVAKLIGSKDKERSDRAVMTAILLALVGGITLMIIGVTFAETLLKMINCPDLLLPKATIYFRLYCLSIPPLMLYNFSASVLRAIGNTKKPMYFLILGGIIKVVFTVLLISLFDWTVEGVGIATIIANVTTSALAFRTLLKSKEYITIDFKNIRFDLKELREILHIGVPAGLQSTLYAFANVVIVTAVNGFGEDATTGVSIANQFDGILYQMVLAPAYAAAPYIAQNVGAGNIKRVKKAIVRAIYVTIAFGATFGFLSAFFSRELSSLMSSSPSIIEFSRQKMIIISSTYFICGINEVMSGVLRGIGKPILPTIFAFLFLFVLRLIWVYAIFPLFPNLTFLYTVWPAGWTLSIICAVVAFFIALPKVQERCYQNASQISK